MGLGSGVQLNGYWEELTTTLDSLERFGWLSHASQRDMCPHYSRPGAMGVEQGGRVAGWQAGSKGLARRPLASERTRADMHANACSDTLARSFRTALACAGGNAAIAAETRTRAATRIKFQSCDFLTWLGLAGRCDGQQRITLP
jgi:hypothetical protein